MLAIVLGPTSSVQRALYRLARIALLGVGTWVFIEVCHVWGGFGAFQYERATWDGRTWHYTGEIVTVCDWRCMCGLPPAAPAQPTQPTRPLQTRRVSETDALRYVTAEVSRAAGEVGIAAPVVRAVSIEEAHPRISRKGVAYVDPTSGEIHVLRWALIFDEKTLQCVARHEVAHVALGHGSGVPTRDAALAADAQVSEFMRKTWDQDARCNLP